MVSIVGVLEKKNCVLLFGPSVYEYASCSVQSEHYYQHAYSVWFT